MNISHEYQWIALVSPDKEEKEIVSIALEITKYLRVHQDAADTPEGIVNWWLQRQRLEQSADRIEKTLQSQMGRGMIQKALELMEERGIVRKRVGKNIRAQKPIYLYAKGNTKKRAKDSESRSLSLVISAR